MIVSKYHIFSSTNTTFISGTDLLSDVTHTLNLKQYLIEDPHESYECEFQAIQYYQQMIDILYGDLQ